MYCTTLQFRNIQKMDRLLLKLVPFLLPVTFTSLDRRTSLLCNLYIRNEQDNIVDDDITRTHLPFVNGQLRDFLKQSHPPNLGYHPVLSRPIPFIISRIVKSLMLVICNVRRKLQVRNVLHKRPQETVSVLFVQFLSR